MAMERLDVVRMHPENQELLQQAIVELKKGATPESVTNYWRAKLPEISIPDCDWTAKAIQRRMKERWGSVPGIMVPDLEEITLPFLGETYPKMELSVSEDTFIRHIIDIHRARGWIKTYASVNAPNLNTTQSQAQEFAETKRYLEQRLKTYILASQESKDLSGQYLDERGTWSRLFVRSCGEGDWIRARFSPDGRLYLYYSIGYGMGHADVPSLGARFEEVKKT